MVVRSIMAKNVVNYRRRRSELMAAIGPFSVSVPRSPFWKRTINRAEASWTRKQTGVILKNCYRNTSCYRTGNQERASRVLEQFTEQDTEQFFEQLGIRIRSREGWLYPASEQAQSFLDLLVLEARFRKVKIKTRETAVAVEKAQTITWCAPKDGSTRLTAS